MFFGFSTQRRIIFFDDDTIANVTLKEQKRGNIAEVTIVQNGIVFRAEVTSDDMFSSIDRSAHIIERQIRKNKTRLEKNLHKDAFKEADYEEADNYVDEEADFEIVRSKKIPLRPMDVEEAILQMNLLQHEFFVFENADTGSTNVVYIRKNGGYGLIEPEE